MEMTRSSCGLSCSIVNVLSIVSIVINIIIIVVVVILVIFIMVIVFHPHRAHYHRVAPIGDS